MSSDQGVRVNFSIVTGNFFFRCCVLTINFCLSVKTAFVANHGKYQYVFKSSTNSKFMEEPTLFYIFYAGL